MTKRTRILIGIIVVMVGLALASWLALRTAERRMLSERLPKGIGVERIVVLSSTPTCGAVIYSLDARTRADLANGQVGARPSGEKWRDTPLPFEAVEGDNRPPYPRGIDCARHLGKARRQTILREASRTGSLYVLDARGLYLLLPKEGWLVYGFFE